MSQCRCSVPMYTHQGVEADDALVAQAVRGFVEHVSAVVTDLFRSDGSVIPAEVSSDVCVLFGVNSRDPVFMSVRMCCTCAAHVRTLLGRFVFASTIDVID